jgi:hypothetical protein
MLQTYVSSVTYACCKCFMWMLQVYYSKRFSYLKRMLQVFYLDVAYVSPYVASVSSRCCICFVMATHMFSWCFQTYVASVLTVRTYVVIVSSRCCKSRSSVTHVAVGPICRSRLLLLGSRACSWVWRDVSGRHEKQCGRRSRCRPHMGTHRRGKQKGMGPHVK